MLSSKFWFYLSEALETLNTDLAEISLSESQSEEENAVCEDNPIFVHMLRDFSNFKAFRNKWVKAILKSDADTMLALSLILLTLIPSPQINQRNMNTNGVLESQEN